MKKRILTSTTIIVALIVVVIAANVIVWNKRLATGAQIASLTAQISQTTREIKSLPAPAADLQTRLAEATANLTAAHAVLPPVFDRDVIIDYIIGLSRECQVEVLPIAVNGWAPVAGSQSSSVLSLTATVTGTFNHTGDFIYRLQHGSYKALVIPELSLTRMPGGSEAFNGDNTIVSVRMSVNIYAGGTAK